jgi:hypothetical protein
MHFLQTNAVDLNGLLIALKNFLSANGWTVLADGTGGGGLTLEMTNANGHSFKFTSRVDAQAAYWTGVSVAFNDRLLQIAYQKSNIGMAAGYTVTPAESNDCSGPFSNVWLFTDAASTYCHCIMQTDNARYNHFSFGDLDNKGLHGVNIPYAMGLYYMYWPNGPNYINGNLPFNAPNHGAHNIGMFCEDASSEVVAGTGRAIRLGVPNGFLTFFINTIIKDTLAEFQFFRLLWSNALLPMAPTRNLALYRRLGRSTWTDFRLASSWISQASSGFVFLSSKREPTKERTAEPTHRT